MIILVVEDSSLELQRICRMLREVKPEARIISFQNSLEAEDEILSRRLRPDVAFLDIEMPAPDGAELARRLISEYPSVNIIFTTAYSSYMQQAFEMFASGYLLKPFSSDEVAKQLNNLRHPLPEEKRMFFAKTIGEFDFFAGGKPVAFTLNRSKEALAYLIDRQGASVTKRELFSILFEDTEYSSGKQDHMKKIMQALKASLERVDADDILLHSRNSYAVDMKKIETDLGEARRSASVPYMEQYAWADGMKW